MEKITFQAKLVKIGTSHGIIVPSAYVKNQLGLDIESPITVTIVVPLRGEDIGKSE